MLKGSSKHVVTLFLSLNQSCLWICTTSALARAVQISANVHELAKHWSHHHRWGLFAAYPWLGNSRQARPSPS